MRCFILFILTLSFFPARSQSFQRAELPTQLNIPWEMLYAPDGYLWITETHGVVSRVHPETGAKTTVYIAPDYFNGSPLETGTLCHKPAIGAGTFGLALHPDFSNDSSAYIYFVYSYNAGDSTQPKTRFKIVRLLWNKSIGTVSNATDLVLNLPTGFDHLGGRLIAVSQGGKSYLFFSTGDNGISDDDEPDCYNPQTTNPNNQAQNPDYPNGKIHRFNMDGSIPADNPIPGNSFYTRGHRNPQGLAFNPETGIVYEAEHGARSDDEVNILKAGMNYGWKWVRGFHEDNNYPNEANFYAAYVPDSRIPGDQLVDPLYSWCTGPQSSSNNYLDWCTVAPSDVLYYGSAVIAAWRNSLLVVSLKNGSNTDQQVFRFRLTPDGKGLLPSTPSNPNPKGFFAEDQAKNGRLRDIAVSPDGKKVFLINNAGTDRDKITVYEYQESGFVAFPNPGKGELNFQCEQAISQIDIYEATGQKVFSKSEPGTSCSLDSLRPGMYFLRAKLSDGSTAKQRLVIEK